MTDTEISNLTIGDIEKLTERLRVAVQTLQDARALIGAPAPQAVQAFRSPMAAIAADLRAGTFHGVPPTSTDAPEAAPRPEVLFVGDDPKTARPVIPLPPKPGVSAFAPMPPKQAALTDLPKDLQREMGMED